MAAVRPLTEASVLAVVLGLSRLCNCKFGFAESKDAASADGTAVLVNDKADAEGFCVLKSVRSQRCASLLLCITCVVQSSSQITSLLKARICGQETKLCCVLYNRKTKCPIAAKASVQ